MNAIDTSPYLQLTPRSEAQARADVAELEGLHQDCAAKVRAVELESAFGAPGMVILNIETSKYGRVVEAFAGTDRHGRTPHQRAYWDAEDGEDETYPKASYQDTICLHPDGTWSRVKLFRGDV